MNEKKPEERSPAEGAPAPVAPPESAAKVARAARVLKGIMADWLDVPQVSERLGVCTATVYTLIQKGALPATKVGRHLRVDPKRLDAWIAAGGASVSKTKEKKEQEPKP